MKSSIRRLSKKLNPFRLFKKFRLKSQQKGYNKSGEKRKELLRKVMENNEIIKNDIETAKDRKRFYETTHDEQVNTGIKVHLAEAFGLKKENEKLRNELRKLRGAKEKPIKNK